MLSFTITQVLLSSVGKEEEEEKACFLLMSVVNKETETPSSLNQTGRTSESSSHTEQREAMKLDLLSLQGYPVVLI